MRGGRQRQAVAPAHRPGRVPPEAALAVQRRQRLLDPVRVARQRLSQASRADGPVVVEEQVERSGEQGVLERRAATEIWEIRLAGHRSPLVRSLLSRLDEAAVGLGFAAPPEPSEVAACGRLMDWCRLRMVRARPPATSIPARTATGTRPALRTVVSRADRWAGRRGPGWVPSRRPGRPQRPPAARRPGGPPAAAAAAPAPAARPWPAPPIPTAR